jgi:hypothetical protein
MKNGIIRGVGSFEDKLEVFYHLSASEIWSNAIETMKSNFIGPYFKKLLKQINGLLCFLSYNFRRGLVDKKAIFL